MYGHLPWSFGLICCPLHPLCLGIHRFLFCAPVSLSLSDKGQSNQNEGTSTYYRLPYIQNASHETFYLWKYNYIILYIVLIVLSKFYWYHNYVFVWRSEPEQTRVRIFSLNLPSQKIFAQDFWDVAYEPKMFTTALHMLFALSEMRNINDELWFRAHSHWDSLGLLD